MDTDKSTVGNRVADSIVFFSFVSGMFYFLIF